MVGKTEFLGVRLTKEEKEDLQRDADKSGKKISDIMRERAFPDHEMPPILEEALQKTANALQLPPNTLVTHILIRRFAFDTAWLEKFGPSKQVWKEFYFEDTADGQRRLVTGQELLDALTDDYERLFDEFNAAIREYAEAIGKDAEADAIVEKFRDLVAGF